MCETWLDPEDEVSWTDYEAVSVNVRKGQGITTFNKPKMDVVLRIGNEMYSIIALQSKHWLMVFMYLSQHAPLDNIVGIVSDLVKQTNGSTLWRTCWCLMFHLGAADMIITESERCSVFAQ